MLLHVCPLNCAKITLQTQQPVWPPRSADSLCSRPPLTLTFDCSTLKLVCESHLRRGTFLQNLGTLGLWVLELFAMYATDGRTDGRMDGQKQCLLLPSIRSGDIIKLFFGSPSIGWLQFSLDLFRATVKLCVE